MVEQNCVYERTMNVVYERITPLGDESPKYEKLRESVNRELYINRIPVVCRYHMSQQDFSDLDIDDYMPHKKTEKQTSYQIWNNDVMLYSNEYAYNRDKAFNLITQYALSCDVSYHDLTHTTKEEEIVTNVETWPTLENVKIIPYAFVDNMDIKVNSYANNISIYTEASGFDEVSLDTTFHLNRSSASLYFVIKWNAPVKSTKAEIERHLVDVPEKVLATVMNLVEKILTESGWYIDDDKTTIDCVTQSNINTKAECSPAVISSLKKTKAEL